MPHKNRKAPGEITIKVKCCNRGITLTTQGDWKQKTCWTCGKYVYFNRFPLKYVEVNGVKTDEWHIVNESPAQDQDDE